MYIYEVKFKFITKSQLWYLTRNLDEISQHITSFQLFFFYNRNHSVYLDATYGNKSRHITPLFPSFLPLDCFGLPEFLTVILIFVKIHSFFRHLANPVAHKIWHESLSGKIYYIVFQEFVTPFGICPWASDSMSAGPRVESRYRLGNAVAYQ